MNQGIEHLHAEKRKDEPRTEIPDEMLSVRQRRKQQGVCRKGLAQLKPAEPAQSRRADAVYQIPEIQREQQLFRPVQHIAYGLAIQLEEIARTEGKHHQMK